MASLVDSKKKKVTLRSSDGAEFDVEEAVATQLEIIKNMIDDGYADETIPLPNVTGSILAKIIEYCSKHVASDDSGTTSHLGERYVDDGLKSWDADFVKVDQGTLFDLILGANYLNVQGLLDLTCQTVAEMMRGKTPEEIRNIFHIHNDYTKEEEEEVRRENQWAFE